jgi:hypothetical protein
MKPQLRTINALDIVVLLKLSTYKNKSWYQAKVAEELFISQSEVSRSVARLKYARLLYPDGKKIMRLALIDILKYGVNYFFPAQPGPVMRGMPTSHSAPPLSNTIVSEEHYVWPSGTGTVRGHSIAPLYPAALKSAKEDAELYELLAMVDALRVGRAREKELAIIELKKRILDETNNE